jgi:uncharacterized Zn finger protein (UPF0148 family)/putative methionine-R-sulfoxide reductase with GAF domain
MQGSAQPEDKFPASSPEAGPAGTTPSFVANAIEGRSQDWPPGRAAVCPEDRPGALEESELDSALQLLVERAQYITGATGTALALPQGEEMVCRASAGSSAPAVGARLQVRSGLTGESIARRQLLRCDNAEADARVNLETCRALGIASIVVLPLLRRNGEVRGLFELFSDHPYAFEERDLIALERMAGLTLTALDLAEERQSSVPAPAASREAEPPREIEAHPASAASPAVAVPIQVPTAIPSNSEPSLAEVPFAEASIAEVLPSETDSAQILTTEPQAVSEEPVLSAAVVPEAMLRVQKCATCGFPVSEGRTFCLDCERKDAETKQRERDRDRDQRQIEKQAEAKQSEPKVESVNEAQVHEKQTADSRSPAPPTTDEYVPAFLANAAPVKESWLSNPVNLLAIAVLILGILVAIVVFR